MKQCLSTDFAENLLVRMKIQIKAWYRILGTEILSNEEFHCKTTQFSEETNYTRQNENSLDSLAGNITSNII